MEWFDGQYLQGADRTDPYLSPLRAADHGGLPPACIVTAEHDRVRAAVFQAVRTAPT